MQANRNFSKELPMLTKKKSKTRPLAEAVGRKLKGRGTVETGRMVFTHRCAYVHDCHNNTPLCTTHPRTHACTCLGSGTTKRPNQRPASEATTQQTR